MTPSARLVDGLVIRTCAYGALAPSAPSGWVVLFGLVRRCSAGAGFADPYAARLLARRADTQRRGSRSELAPPVLTGGLSGDRWGGAGHVPVARRAALGKGGLGGARLWGALSRLVSSARAEENHVRVNERRCGRRASSPLIRLRASGPLSSIGRTSSTPGRRRPGATRWRSRGAEGSVVWDFAGKRYLDFSSQLVNANIGHGHPKVVAAIQEQAALLPTVAPQHANAARSEAARLITELAPEGLNKVFFTNGGADAIENAVRMARLHTGRRKVLSFYRSYHGNTGAAIAATGDPRRWPNEFADAHVPLLRPAPVPHALLGRDRRAGVRARAGASVGRDPVRGTGHDRRHPDRDDRRALPACWCRRRDIWRACAGCATSTESC